MAGYNYTRRAHIACSQCGEPSTGEGLCAQHWKDLNDELIALRAQVEALAAENARLTSALEHVGRVLRAAGVDVITVEARND